MNQALLERERVNERFQGGTGRAWTARSVDLAVDVDLVEIGRTDLREDFHCSRVDEQRSSVLDSAIAVRRDVIGDPALDRLLFFQVERGDDFIAPVRILQHLPNKMRREEFFPGLNPGAKLPRRKFSLSIDPGAVVPIGLRLIDRAIVAFVE